MPNVHTNAQASAPHRLHIRTWLSPSVPLEYVEAIGDVLHGALGLEVVVSAELTCSGPKRDARDPLTSEEVDIGLMCSPPYRWLRNQTPPGGVLLPVIHVFDDERTRGQPVYFADVYVRSEAPYQA